MRTLTILALIGHCLSGCAPPANIGPIAAHTRLLNTAWQFQRLNPNEKFDRGSKPPHWQDVRLPHTANIEPRIVNHQWQGDALYRRTLYAEKSWR